MNEVKIVEGGHYKMQSPIGYTENLYLIKLRKIKTLFGERDGIVYSPFDDGSFEDIMTIKKFKSKVLYKVN